MQAVDTITLSIGNSDELQLRIIATNWSGTIRAMSMQAKLPRLKPSHLEPKAAHTTRYHTITTSFQILVKENPSAISVLEKPQTEVEKLKGDKQRGMCKSKWATQPHKAWFQLSWQPYGVIFSYQDSRVSFSVIKIQETEQLQLFGKLACEILVT